jgi:DMSO/TMAO reductase YedYZ molybdopterin-dependent catalytic subunit
MADPEKLIISPDMKRPNRVPPGQHLIKDWPVLHYGRVHDIPAARWTFEITGEVEKPLKLTYTEFAALPRVKVFSDIHCVTTWSRLDNTWEGPGTLTVAGLVKIKPEAGFVIVHGAGGFTTNLPLADFLAEDCLFTFSFDGKPLTAEHGAPVRLIVPRLYFWKSAKWVTGIEFSNVDRPGFWEGAGYHNHGDPWTEERRQGRW